jgi:predicted homoserine dehydrogenase-like protein
MADIVREFELEFWDDYTRGRWPTGTCRAISTIRRKRYGKEAKIGVIGAGHGQQCPSAQPDRNNDCDVVAVCDLIEEKVNRAATASACPR